MSKINQIAEVYQSGQISSLDFLGCMLSAAAEADSPTLSSLHDDLKEKMHIPVPLSRFVEDIDALASDMQKCNTTSVWEIDIRRHLRELVWIKHRIKDNNFYEAAYAYISRFYADSAA